MRNKAKYFLFITLFTVTAIVYGQTDIDANNRGMTALKQYDYDTAVTEFTEAIRLNPNIAVYYFYRGEAYNFKEDWDKAIDDFTKAIQLNPNYAEAYASRAWAYYGLNDITNALANIDAAKQIDPDNSSANYLYGEIVPEQKKDESNTVIIIFLLLLLIIIAVFICIFRSKKIKIKYNPFIAMFSFIGFIIAILVFLSFGFVIAAIYTNGFQDVPFLKQTLLLAAVYFLFFPVIMVLISNVYFKTRGRKTWGNWLKVSLNYGGVFTVIAVYQCAFALIEILIFCNNIISVSYHVELIIMFTVPFLLFFLSKQVLKKIFGYTSADGVTELIDGETIDPNNFTIRQPVYALVIYIVISIFFLLLYVAVLVGTVDGGEDLARAAWFYFVCMSPFILFGPFLIFIRSRWKIVIKDKQIKYTTYFGRTKTCTFDYITKVTQGIRHTKTGTLNIITVYHDKKMLFVVSHHCSGYNEFFQRLKDSGTPGII